MFSCEFFGKIFKNTIFYRKPLLAASVNIYFKTSIDKRHLITSSKSVVYLRTSGISIESGKRTKLLRLRADLTFTEPNTDTVFGRQ